MSVVPNPQRDLAFDYVREYEQEHLSYRESWHRQNHVSSQNKGPSFQAHGRHGADWRGCHQCRRNDPPLVLSTAAQFQAREQVD
jgi:hypothetical protein